MSDHAGFYSKTSHSPRPQKPIQDHSRMPAKVYPDVAEELDSDVAEINYQMPSASRPDLRPRITIAGVGGAGLNALERIGHIKENAVRLLALNTDAQSLERSQADEIFCLGESLTRGFGAGGDPELGAQAAIQDRHHIAALLRGSDITFVIAGLGGGTGAGAAPVVASIAREIGSLTIGVASLPFSFEGARRMKMAQEGLERLAQCVDTLIVMPNDALLRVASTSLSMTDAFARADELIHRGIAGIVNIVTEPGLINVDLSDIRAALLRAGPGLLSVGEASGENRAARAVDDAMRGSWLDAKIAGASRALVNITGSPDMSFTEVTEIAQTISSIIAEDAHCVFGAVIDNQLQDTIRVTLVVTGIPAIAA